MPHRVAMEVHMPRVSIPAGHDPRTHVWALAGPAGAAAMAFSSAVMAGSMLSLREYESARISIAGVNDCELCLSWRSAAAARGNPNDPASLPEDFYACVLARRFATLSTRERLCADYATRFASDHLAMGDDLWIEMHEQFTDAEIVDLTLCVGSCLVFGRINRVLDIDGGCRVGAV